MDKPSIPQHVAIIMDGNGRWAKEHGLDRSEGHKQGIDRIKEIVRAAEKLGIKVITFFTFSNENWNRPKQEVDFLMYYLGDFLDRNIKDIHKDNIRYKFIGRDHPVPEKLLKKIANVEDLTKNNDGLTVMMALNYGSRQEIVDAVRKIVEAALKDEIKAQDLDEEKFSSFLYTAGLPDPDLLIRTSGEERISNFLLWQLSYAELYFPDKYWPDFHAEDLELAIEEYQRRERRFGRVEGG